MHYYFLLFKALSVHHVLINFSFKPVMTNKKYLIFTCDMLLQAQGQT